MGVLIRKKNRFAIPDWLLLSPSSEKIHFGTHKCAEHKCIYIHIRETRFKVMIVFILQ